jgi:chromosome partitioning protein
MRTLAVAIHKGGVAKTTSAVNLAAGLAQAGFRTLLVDVDPQANATFWFVDEEDDIDYDLGDVITKKVPIDKVILPTRVAGLDLLPSTLALATLDIDLVSLTRREDRVKMALGELEHRYDVVVLDLAPSLSLVNLAALVAATDIISPVSAKKLSLKGFGAFMRWTDTFRAEGLITAPLLAVLATMVDDRTRVSREVVAALRAAELPVFESVIPYRVGAEDQVAGRLVVGDPHMHPDIDAAYRGVVTELIERLGLRRG